MINELNEHTIVCGFGRNGRQAVKRLKKHQQPFVVVETNEELIAENEKDLLFYKGSALSELRKHTNCNVIGYRDAKGKQYINPDAHMVLESEGKLIILGTRDAIKKLNQMFQLD
jgi:Trk K+ transport system NAD-binding subunit